MNNARLRNVDFERNLSIARPPMTESLTFTGAKHSNSLSFPGIVNQEGFSALAKFAVPSSTLNHTNPSMDSIASLVSNIQNVQIPAVKRNMDNSVPINPFKDLDEAFATLRLKLRTPESDNSVTLNTEKLKFSRAIKCIFKNNLTETIVKDIKIINAECAYSIHPGKKYEKNVGYFDKKTDYNTVLKEGVYKCPANNGKPNNTIVNANHLTITPSTNNSSLSNSSLNSVNCIKSLNLLKDLKANNFLSATNNKNVNIVPPFIEDNNSKK
jgi:hypothetical protein